MDTLSCLDTVGKALELPESNVPFREVDGGWLGGKVKGMRGGRE